MTDLYDERITAMKATEIKTWRGHGTHRAAIILNADFNEDETNRARLAAYRRKRMERQGTAQRIFWGPW